MSAHDIREAIAGKQPGTSGYVRSTCPRCPQRHGTPDRHASLSVAPSGWFRCWRCSARGKLEPEYDGEFEDLEPHEELANRLGAAALPDGYIPLASDEARSSAACRPALDYLAGRAVGGMVIEDAELGVVLRGDLAHRIVIPAWGPTGDLVGWQARTYCDAEPKALSCPGMQRSTFLYNGGATISDPVFVVEGPFDAFALWPDAVATWGMPTDHHIHVLTQWSARRRIVLALDGDAWLEAQGIAMRMHMHSMAARRSVVAVRLPPGEDPASLGGAAVRDMAAQAFASAWLMRRHFLDRLSKEGDEDAVE